MANTSFSSGFGAGAGAIIGRDRNRLLQQQLDQEKRNQLIEANKANMDEMVKQMSAVTQPFADIINDPESTPVQKAKAKEDMRNAQIPIFAGFRENAGVAIKNGFMSEGEAQTRLRTLGIAGVPVNPVPAQNIEAQAKGKETRATEGAKQEFKDFVRMENAEGQAIAVRKGDTPPEGFVPVSATASKQDITTTDLTKPNVTEQQGIEIDATRSAFEARELADRLTSSDVGLRGVANTALAVTIGQIFESAVDKDVLNNRQAARALTEKTLKSMSDDKRFSNLDREAIEKLFIDMGAFESVTSARTKLLGLADILEQRAAFSAGLLGHKPIHELRQDEIIDGMKSGVIEYSMGRRALINYHGFGE
jgi:hypothetical protein